MIEELEKQGWLKSQTLKKAFKKIKREDFLPDNIKNLAELNRALPIGFGQTISQPLVVAFMIELLKPERGERILDIGAGSGWTGALLAELVGPSGKVIGLEIIPELKDFAERNIARYNFIEKGTVEVFCLDGSKGYEKEAPFDKILVSAAAENKVPLAWKKQLKNNGRIVFPMDSSIWLYLKKSEDQFEQFEYPGFAFVPLVEKNKPLL